jgi:L-threonylcarbamoyladenylate synthase
MNDEVILAIRRGEPVVIPTDTVYGLVTTPFHPAAVERLSAMKHRDPAQPIALLAPDLETLFKLMPQLRGRPGVLARALLPGPLTLVLPNRARRFGWLNGERKDTIGVRVPELPDLSAGILRAVGALAATSANLHGGPEPATLEDVPAEIREGAGAVLDGGTLPGIASTVVDLTGDEPQILREGAVASEDVLERVSAALA